MEYHSSPLGDLKRSSNSIMKCPNCNETMRHGEARLKKSLWNMLAFGWGSTELVFRDDQTKAEVELMNSWEFSKANLCSSCGAVVVATDLGSK
jgi:predicted RNA-binding Zn-ribbon protein involved in translation (DUF1610 family)